jgi:hypothetical protein
LQCPFVSLRHQMQPPSSAACCLHVVSEFYEL